MKLTGIMDHLTEKTRRITSQYRLVILPKKIILNAQRVSAIPQPEKYPVVYTYLIISYNYATKT